MAGVTIVPIWLSGVTNGTREIVVVDETKQFNYLLRNTGNVKFNYTFLDANLDSVRSIYKDNKSVSILFIPQNIMTNNEVIMHSAEQPGLNILSYISNEIATIIERSKLKQANLNPDVIDSIKTTVNIKNNVGEEEKDNELSIMVGLVASVLIYMFVFIYSAQVMRGVIEEKTSRIVEVIISSVKPFQLMMGKIIGVAMVGLTQFLLWVILTLILSGAGMAAFAKSQAIDVSKIEQQYDQSKFSSAPEAKQKTKKKIELSEAGKKIIENINRVNWTLMISSFLFYFLGGYLLYSALFAAIGAAVDNEADTQQFMLPVTIPLILSFSMYSTIIQDPHGPAAFWFSIFPLTAPVTMMMRLSFGMTGHEWELALSMVLLVLGFIGTTWLAGKIYRTGILMYGKKVTYKELWKWLFYKG